MTVLQRRRVLVLCASLLAWPAAQAGALEALREFTSTARSGKASFTQVVTSPSGEKKRPQAGTFEFQRPNRFRFSYAKPFEQLIVADGQRLWLFDVDLNQVTVRRQADALAATPAALLAGGDLSRDFDLTEAPPREGLDWVLATPKRRDGAIQSVRIGFRGRELAALEIADGLGQRSLLTFSGVQLNAALPAELFRFVPPRGADVVEQ
jgi:outer membrane lipoprotein carrier protein